MDTSLYTIIKDFGFPVFCTLVLGFVVWKLYLRLDAKCDALNAYIREDLHKLTNNYSKDQKVLVDIIREIHPNMKRPSHGESIFDKVNPHDETHKIIEAVRS